MNKRILDVENNFAVISILYCGRDEELEISVYEKRTASDAYGCITFKEFEKLINNYRQAKKSKYKDCLNCVHSSSEKTKYGDVLHCEKRNGEIVDDNYCCDFYKGD